MEVESKSGDHTFKHYLLLFSQMLGRIGILDRSIHNSNNKINSGVVFYRLKFTLKAADDFSLFFEEVHLDQLHEPMMEHSVM